jgi:hypothetical protein
MALSDYDVSGDELKFPPRPECTSAGSEKLLSTRDAITIRHSSAEPSKPMAESTLWSNERNGISVIVRLQQEFATMER